MKFEPELTIFEIDIIKAIAKHNPCLNTIIPDLKVKHREYTGPGLYVNFELTAKKIKCVSNLLDLFGIIILPQGLELFAHIELLDGKPDFLEVATSPLSDWNGNFEGYRIKN